jgi:ABC-type polysaccharide/polyol phosphate export permease
MAYTAVVGIVGAGLFNQDIHQYLPYLASGMIVWTFISTMILESCTLFVTGHALFRNVREAELIHLRTQLGDLTAEVLDLRPLRAQLMAVQQSTSWRVTKPLRQVSSLLRMRAGPASRA